jgi:hypothetical protein
MTISLRLQEQDINEKKDSIVLNVLVGNIMAYGAHGERDVRALILGIEPFYLWISALHAYHCEKFQLRNLVVGENVCTCIMAIKYRI